MKKVCMALMVAGSALLISGCLVRSVYPWLPENTKVGDVSLAGVWYDEKGDDAAFFTLGAHTNYSVLFIGDKKDTASFTASLHRLDETLLLVVGSPEQGGLDGVTRLPAHLLFRVALQNDAMKLYAIDLDSFGDRLKAAHLKSLDEGSKTDGYVLFSRTEEMAAFARTQLKDPTFFDETPLYSFKRVSAK